MIKLLKYLFTGSWHEHKYVVVQKDKMYNGKNLAYNIYICRCSECGKMKSYKL